MPITKEQEAIKNLTDLLKQRDEKEVQITTYDLFGNIETVLSMLKEKDKQIDLMAEFISKQDIEEDICIKNKTNPDLCNEDYTNCKDCIKQYYERKSKE